MSDFDAKNEPDTLQLILEEGKAHLFHLQFALTLRSHISRNLAVLFALIRTLQLLSFPFSLTFDFPWNHSATNWLAVACNAVRFDVLAIGRNVEDNADQGLLFAVMLSVFGTIALAAHHAFQLRERKSFNLLLTPYVQALVAVISTVLYIPLMGVLLSPLRCTEPSGSTLSCGSSTHLILAVLCGLAALALMAVALIQAGAWYQDVDKESYLAQIHGRVDVVLVLCMTVQCFMFNILQDNSSSTHWVLAISCVATSMTSLYLSSWYVPLLKEGANILRIAECIIVAWASLCLVVTLLFDDETKLVGTVLFLAVLPMTSTLARFIVQWRFELARTTEYKEFTSPFDYELKSRLYLAENSQQASDDDFDGMGVNEENESIRVGSDDGTRHDTRNEDLHLEVEGWMKYGARHLVDDPLIWLFLSRLYNFEMNNRHMAQRALVSCEERVLPFDTQFVIYRYRKQIEQEIESNKDSVHVLAYMNYIENMKSAEEKTQAAARAQFRFWTELLQEQPKTETLNALGQDINHLVTQAYINFREIMRINRDSPMVMRAYGNFLTNQLNDEVNGTSLLERADERETKAKGQKLDDSSTDHMKRLFLDSTAVITISGEYENVGEVVSANDAACQLWGRSPAEVVGNNISQLLPPPFADFHDQFLRRYQDTGQGVVFNHARKLFGMAKTGYIFPVRLIVKQVSGGGLSKTVFLGICNEITTSEKEHVALVDVKNQNVIRCSAGFSKLFGISLEAMRSQSEECDLKQFLPDWDDVDESEAATLAIDIDAAPKAGAIGYRSRDGKEAILSKGPWKYIIQAWSIRLVFPEVTVDVVRILEKDRVFEAPPSEEVAGPVTSQLSEPIEPVTNNMDSPPSQSDDDIASDSLLMLQRHEESDDEETAAPADADGVDVGLHLDTARAKFDTAKDSDDESDEPAYANGHSNGVERGLALKLSPQQRRALHTPRTPVSLGRQSSRTPSLGGRKLINGQTSSPLPLRTGEVEMPRLNSARGGRGSPPLRKAQSDDEEEEEEAREKQRRKSRKSRKKKKSSRKNRDDDDGSDNESGASASQASSQTSTGYRWKSGVDRIRKLFLSQSNQVEPSMQWLRLAIAGTILVTLGVSIAGIVVLKNSFDSYTNQVRIIHEAGSRRMFTTTVAQQVLTLDLIRQGVENADKASYARSTLDTYATLLWNEHIELYHSSRSDEHEALYNTRAIPTQELVGQHVETRLVNLVDAVQRYTSSARQLVDRPIAEFAMTNPHVYYIFANHDVMTKYLNQSTRMYEETEIESTQHVQLLQTSILVTALGVMVIMVAVVIVPAIGKVEATRRRVFKMFVDLPLETVKQIQQRKLKQLSEDEQNMEAQENTDRGHLRDEAQINAAINAQAGGVRGGGGNAEFGERQGAGRPRGGRLAAENANANANQNAGAAGLKRKHVHHKPKERFRYSSRDKYMLFVRVSALVLVALVYFCGTFLWETQVLDTSLKRLPEVDYSVAVKYLARSTVYNARRVVVAPAWQTNSFINISASVSYQLALDTEGFADFLQNALIFGSDSNGLAGSNGRTGGYNSALQQMQQENACPFITVAGCDTFSGGLMTFGLSRALNEYFTMIKGVMASAQAAGANLTTVNHTLSTRPWTDIVALDETYMGDALEEQSHMYLQAEIARVNDFLALRNAVMGAFVALVVVLYLAVYVPLIQRLDHALKRTRGMLLLVPVDQMEKSPELRKLITQVHI